MTREMMNGLNHPTPHFVLIPFMAQGHMIPMVDLGRLLAERGMFTTVITTPFNASRFKTNIDRATDSSLPIHFVPLHFPCSQVGLPEGCENFDLIPSPNLTINFFLATSMLDRPLEAYLRAHQPYPTCIISDSCHPWTIKVARNLQVPRLTFFGVSCFALLCTHNITLHGIFDTIVDNTEPVVVPSLAHRIELTKAQSPEFFPGPIWKQLREEIEEADQASDAVVVNTFDELEPWYINNYQRAMGKKVWVLGPLSLCNKQVVDMASRGKEASIDKDQCLRWLDAMDPRSVLYVSFGSIAYTSSAQLIELGLGLEASERPFVWVIRELEKHPAVERWLSEGFEERTRSKSLIVKGWAPQVMILSHPAVGGFMTHCGWNSSIEGVSAGVPMITWLFFADQFANGRMIVDVLRIGVEVGVKDPCLWTAADDQVLVTKDEVDKAVHMLMDEGEVGEERWERAWALREMARKAMEEGGSSHVSMDLMIEHISEQARKKKHVEEKMELQGEE